MSRGAFVFGYGSLVEPWPDAAPARLRGWSRHWGVAMDNRRDLPGYKYYVTPDGVRPEVYVCFLDVAPAGAAALVEGVCRPVDATALAMLDARERNYDRVDVTAAVEGAPPGARVWTYVGSAPGRRRLADGVAAGTAVIASSYLARVPAPDPGDLPVVDLERRDLPGRGSG